MCRISVVKIIGCEHCIVPILCGHRSVFEKCDGCFDKSIKFSLHSRLPSRVLKCSLSRLRCRNRENQRIYLGFGLTTPFAFLVIGWWELMWFHLYLGGLYSPSEFSPEVADSIYSFMSIWSGFEAKVRWITSFRVSVIEAELSAESLKNTHGNSEEIIFVRVLLVWRTLFIPLIKKVEILYKLTT